MVDRQIAVANVVSWHATQSHLIERYAYSAFDIDPNRLAAVMHKSIYSPQNRKFLTLLRRHRILKRLRQVDVGLRLGKDQGMVSKVESGERRLDVIELRVWLQALEVDFLTFMKELEELLSRS